MKYIITGALITFLNLTPTAYANTCLDEYNERIDAISTYYSGYGAGHLLFKNFEGFLGGALLSGIGLNLANFSLYVAYGIYPGPIPANLISSGVAVAVPLAITAGYVADTIADKPFVKMMKVIARAYIEAGISDDEVLRNDFIAQIPVDGVTRDEIRQQRDYNRHAKKHNQKIEKLNKAITSRINARIKSFDNLIMQLEELTGKPASRLEVAKLVVDADSQGKLCNSEIRLLGKDLTLRTDYIRVTGETPLERMTQRNHNRKVERHNKKIAKMIEKNDLAMLKHLLTYLKANLY
jgi:hypothetical protein